MSPFWFKVVFNLFGFVSEWKRRVHWNHIYVKRTMQTQLLATKHQTKINVLMMLIRKFSRERRRSRISDNVNRTDRYLILISTHMKMMIIDDVAFILSPQQTQSNQIEKWTNVDFEAWASENHQIIQSSEFFPSFFMFM